MEHTFAHAISVFMAFFAIMNPIANTAVFAGLTASMDKNEQSRIAGKSLLIAFAVIVVFALLGKSIFHLFGITLNALRITGGILIFLVGYHMLHGKSSKLHSTESDSDKRSLPQTGGSSDLAVSPLAVPVLAGPGTIATAMNYSASGGVAGIITTVVAFSVICVVTYICFISSSRIIGIVGDSGLAIVTRLMGLILAVIGVQMLIVGITAVLPSHPA